jgi:hypothetical protein
MMEDSADLGLRSCSVWKQYLEVSVTFGNLNVLHL